METPIPLYGELKVFEENHRNWAESHLGKFVVIQDATVIDSFFDAYEDAFIAGARQFGPDRNFLVKQIWKVEPVYFVA